MKRKPLIASALIVVLIALCAASLFATWQGLKIVQASGVHFRGFSPYRVSAKATEEKNLNVSGPVNLTVENDLGNIDVQTGADGQVNIKSEKTAWGSSDADAQAALKELKVIVVQNGDSINISVQQPAQVDVLNMGPGYGSVKFTVTVPKQTSTNLHSSNGNTKLDGTTGNADVQSDFGDVTITNTSGDVLGKSNNGTVTGRNINSDGKVTFSSDFGSIVLDQVKGLNVSATSANGRIDLTGVQAGQLLEASSQFGDVHVNNSQAGTANVHSSNGAVTLEKLEVSGKITVKSDFGDLKLTGVNAGSYDLTTQNGKIDLDGAQNSVKAHSSFGRVEVLNARNATIDLASNNGDVIFSGSLGNGPHSATSDFGNIKLSLPAASALNAELKTDFGKITSDFSISVNGDIDDNHWVGNINGGGAVLTAKTNNGNITLQALK
jgi:DUF4097 and DUF4098 domain-containing protein YvlB